jgi:hypothetical protein
MAAHVEQNSAVLFPPEHDSRIVTEGERPFPGVLALKIVHSETRVVRVAFKETESASKSSLLVNREFFGSSAKMACDDQDDLCLIRRLPPSTRAGPGRQ